MDLIILGIRQRSDYYLLQINYSCYTDVISAKKLHLSFKEFQDLANVYNAKFRHFDNDSAFEKKEDIIEFINELCIILKLRGYEIKSS